MRKISELLPIVRRHLMHSGNLNGDEYICYAVSTARTRQRLSPEEADALPKLIYARMDRQNPDGFPNVVLIDCLRELGVLKFGTPACNVRDPAYWVHRDKWLDDWYIELTSKGE